MTTLDIRIRCPKCDRPLRQADAVPEEAHLMALAAMAGAEIECPHCGMVALPDDERRLEDLVDRRIH